MSQNRFSERQRWEESVVGVIWHLQFPRVGIEVLRNGVLSCRNGLPDPGGDRELLRSHQHVCWGQAGGNGAHIQHTSSDHPAGGSLAANVITSRQSIPGNKEELKRPQICRKQSAQSATNPEAFLCWFTSILLENGVPATV